MLTRNSFIKSCMVAVAAMFLPKIQIKNVSDRAKTNCDLTHGRVGFAEEILNAPLRKPDYMPLRFRQYEQIKEAFGQPSEATMDAFKKINERWNKIVDAERKGK
tara:strand:- start:1178 stop:1489 length:312 start_codon:yes stop_codon:yes gene_type:complete